MEKLFLLTPHELHEILFLHSLATLEEWGVRLKRLDEEDERVLTFIAENHIQVLRATNETIND